MSVIIDMDKPACCEICPLRNRVKCVLHDVLYVDWSEEYAHCPLRPAPEHERWIPVAERLPENGRYLCRSEVGVHSILECVDGKFNVFRLLNGKLYDKSEIKDIAYWMPLPEPPKEEEKE